MKCYSELKNYDSYLDRFKYLKLDGKVGIETFGFDRYVNQSFYKSSEWKRVRREVIIRDNCCDLGCENYEINGKIIIVHHMNPITQEDITDRIKFILDPEFLITTVIDTHRAIHYGDDSLLVLDPIIRRENDTIPWRK